MSRFGQINNTGSNKGFGSGNSSPGRCAAQLEVSPKPGNKDKGTAFGFWEYQIYMGDCPECVGWGQCPEFTKKGVLVSHPCRLDSPDTGHGLMVEITK